MKRYILIGLGPHAERIYYPLLEKYKDCYGIRLELLIDLKGKSGEIKNFLSKRKLFPEKIVLINNSHSNRLGFALDPIAEEALNAVIAKNKIDGIIISTEPKAHKIYAAWALKHNINILMDKPISAPLWPTANKENSLAIYRDYTDLEKLKKKSKSKFYVVCQRREHPGYIFIKEYLRSFMKDFGVPISYIDIYHADGSWTLPHEFNKENHPYKYGYGKLMHSGYHFIDLFCWLSELNLAYKKFSPTSIKLQTNRFTPRDFIRQISKQSYKKLFGRSLPDSYKISQRRYKNFGELDAHIQVQLLRGSSVITTGSINLLQNSFSRRNSFPLPADTYKGNGRVRHERINIQLSHLLNVQVHSYQAHGLNKDKIRSGQVGSSDHFDIYIFRNNDLIGGKAFEKICLGAHLSKIHRHDESYLGHNESARETTMRNFILGKSDNSEFDRHKFTTKLLSKIYESIAQEKKTGNSQLIFPVKN